MKDKGNFKIVLLVIAVFVAVILFIYFVNKKDPTKDIPPIVNKDSLVGCYVAHLGKDIYTLNIQSDKEGVIEGLLAYNNYQKDSSSGSFNGTFQNNILLGKYSFDSEGMHSERQVIFKKVGDSFVQGSGPVKVINNEETFDPISEVTYDSKSTFVKSNNCIEKYTDPNNTFTFEYNPFFKYIEGFGPSTDWKVRTNETGLLLAGIIIPRTYMLNTNFSDSKFTIGRSTTPNAIKSCTATSGNETKEGSITMNGYPFNKFTSSEAAAGNLYETTSYRGILDGDCYAIEYTIHSTNIGNYSPDQNIKEFNKEVIKNENEKIIKSIIFLINSD